MGVGCAHDVPDSPGRRGPGHDLDEVGSTAYETRNQTLGIAFKNGQHLLEAKLGRQDVPEQLFPNQRMDMLKNTQDRLNLRYAGEFAWGALEARVYQEKVDHFMDFGADKQFQYGTAPGMPLNTESKTTGLSVNANLDLRAGNQLRLGTEFQHYALNRAWQPPPCTSSYRHPRPRTDAHARANAPRGK